MRNSYLPPKSKKNQVNVVRLQNFSLLNRARQFYPAELKKFCAPISARWQEQGVSGGRITADDLLAAEREAILSVGMESDLKDLNKCRRKALEALPADKRHGYVDLLLTLANFHFSAGKTSEARIVLERIVAVEKENWHVLKELAIIAGSMGETRLAISYFERARDALGPYRENFEVEPAVEWEAAAYAAIFRASVDFEYLDPLFSIPEEVPDDRLKEMYAFALDLLIKKEIPAKTIWRMFARTIPAGREVETELRSLKPLPLHLPLIAKKAAALKGVLLLPREIAVELVPEQRDALEALYAYERIDRTLSQKGPEAEAEAREVLANMTNPANVAAGELALFIENKLKEVNDEAAVSKLARIFTNFDYSSIRELAVEIKKTLNGLNGPEARDAAREETAWFLTRLVENKRPWDATQLADELWTRVPELQPLISAAFAKMIEGGNTRSILTAFLRKVRGETIAMARNVAKGEHAPSGATLSSIELPPFSSFADRAQLHDLFFVKLKSLPAVRDLFRELEGIAYAEPMPLASAWFMMLAQFTEDARVKEALFDRALEQSKDNAVAKVEKARCLGMGGEYARSISYIDQLLAAGADPALKISLASIKMADLVQLYEKDARQVTAAKALKKGKLTKGKGKANTKVKVKSRSAELFELANDTYSLARSVWGALPSEVKEMAEGKNDLANIEINLARLFSLRNDLTAALACLERALEAQPNRGQAWSDKAYLLLLLGEFQKCVRFSNDAIGKSDGDEIIFREYALDSFFYSGSIELHIQLADQLIKRYPKHLPFLLNKAQLLFRLGKTGEVKRIIALVEAKIDGIRGEIPSRDLARLEGSLYTAKGEVFALDGDQRGARESYEAVLRMLSGAGFEALFKELQAAVSYIESLTYLASLPNGVKELNQKAVDLARSYLQRYPFFPVLHQVIIPPLINLNREAEAAGHFARLMESDLGLTMSNFANLLYLTASEDPKAAESARATLLLFKSQASSGEFQQYLIKAIELAKEHYSSWNEAELLRFLN